MDRSRHPHGVATGNSSRLVCPQDYRRLLGGPTLLPPAHVEAAAGKGQGQGEQQGQRQRQQYSYFYPLGPLSQEGLLREWESQGPAQVWLGVSLPLIF